MEKPIAGQPVVQPSMAALFFSFVRIGMMSFGGGLAAWTRQEIVQNKGWLDDRQFLSGYTLSQLVPGATNVNLAVFIGTQLRGGTGAITCVCGLTALPLVIVLILGALYLRSTGHTGTGGAWLSLGLGGMGAVAIGLNLGTGVRLVRRNISSPVPIIITLAIAVSIGIFGFPLVHVLLIMMPISLLAAWLTWPR